MNFSAELMIALFYGSIISLSAFFFSHTVCFVCRRRKNRNPTFDRYLKNVIPNVMGGWILNKAGGWVWAQEKCPRPQYTVNSRSGASLGCHACGSIQTTIRRKNQKKNKRHFWFGTSRIFSIAWFYVSRYFCLHRCLVSGSVAVNVHVPARSKCEKHFFRHFMPCTNWDLQWKLTW